MLFRHEVSYRGAGAVERLGQTKIVICGAGALGSHLVDNLVRHGVKHITVIDMDRVEQHNIGTQVYDQSDIGAWKAEVLRRRAFAATGVELDAVAKQLTDRNIAKLLRGADLVLDTFDNSASRRLVFEHCATNTIPCLNLDMNADYGEVHWNEGYRVPNDVVGGDVCDYPLARNLILFIVALGSEAVLRFVLEGQQHNFSFTLQDLAINSE